MCHSGSFPLVDGLSLHSTSVTRDHGGLGIVYSTVQQTLKMVQGLYTRPFGKESSVICWKSHSPKDSPDLRSHNGIGFCPSRVTAWNIDHASPPLMCDQEASPVPQASPLPDVKKGTLGRAAGSSQGAREPGVWPVAHSTILHRTEWNPGMPAYYCWGGPWAPCPQSHV